MQRVELGVIFDAQWALVSRRTGTGWYFCHSLDAMLLLYLLKILLSDRDVVRRRGELHLFGLMVEHNEISVHEVEAIESVAGILRIHDIFVDDIGGSLGGVGGASPNLPDGAVLAEEIEQGGRVDVVWQVLDEEDAVGFGRELVAAGHAAALLTSFCRGGVDEDMIWWAGGAIVAGPMDVPVGNAAKMTRLHDRLKIRTTMEAVAGQSVV